MYILPSHFPSLSAQYSVATLNAGEYLLIIYTGLHCVAISLLDVWAKLPAHRQLGINCAEYGNKVSWGCHTHYHRIVTPILLPFQMPEHGFCGKYLSFRFPKYC